jgi:hypothetical protein
VAAGVDAYLVDFAAAQKTHYLVDGTTVTVPMILEPGPIAPAFDGDALVAAIRGAQADTVRYPEFVKAVDGGGCDRVLGVSGRQEINLLWPEGRTAY